MDLGKGAIKLFSDTFNYLVGDKSVEAAPIPVVSKFAPSEYDPIIKQSANKYNIKEDLIKAVIQAESGGDPNARSRMNARGLMQLTPITVKELRKSGLNINPRIPEQNIEGGTKYLADLVNKYEGNIEHALAAYNGGPGKFHKAGRNINNMRRETRNYVPKVMNLYNNGFGMGEK
jgi:soluble lytic murein transglycosylase-like protein